MKFCLPSLSSLLSLALIAASTTVDARPSGSGRVVITNNSPNLGVLLTPVWFAIHDGGFDIYNRNEAASPALESLAEDGATFVGRYCVMALGCLSKPNWSAWFHEAAVGLNICRTPLRSLQR